MIPIALSPVCMMPLNYSSHLISLQGYVEMAEITLKQRRNQKEMKLKFDGIDATYDAEMVEDIYSDSDHRSWLDILQLTSTIPVRCYG
jgi:hypothetical protein